jgi:hypothetical protein
MGDRSVTVGECPSCAGTSSFPFLRRAAQRFKISFRLIGIADLKSRNRFYRKYEREGEPVPLVLHRISFCLRKRIQKHREFNHAAPTFRVFAG